MKTSTSSISIPDGVPRLARGRHRSARSGACFMEFASYLAGEPWSDHPRCTDPLLAHLARCVNDAMRDERRGELLPLVPRVVGLRGRDDALAPVIAVRAAAAALPVASMGRQCALAGAMLALEPHIPERMRDRLLDAARDAFDAAPHATRWAYEHLDLRAADTRALLRRGTTAIVQTAVDGIAEACIEDPDTRLRDLLAAAIDDAERMLGQAAPDGPDAASAAATDATIGASSARAGVSDTLVARVS